MRHHLRPASLLPTFALMSALTACGGGDYHAPVNVAPVASAGPAQTVDAGTIVALAGSGTDANQDVITYLWTLTRPATSITTLENYHVATPTFTADVAGTYVATLKVNDGQVDSTPSSVTITAQVPVKAFVALWSGNSCATNQRIWTIDGHLVLTAAGNASGCIGTSVYQLYESAPTARLCVVGGLATATSPCASDSNNTLMNTVVANISAADLGLGASHQVQQVYSNAP